MKGGMRGGDASRRGEPIPPPFSKGDRGGLNFPLNFHKGGISASGVLADIFIYLILRIFPLLSPVVFDILGY